MDVQHGKIGARGRVIQRFRVELLISFDGADSRVPVLRLAKPSLGDVALNQRAECRFAGFLTPQIRFQPTSLGGFQGLGLGFVLLRCPDHLALANALPLGGRVRANDKPRQQDRRTGGSIPRPRIDNVLASLHRVLSVRRTRMAR